MRPIVLDIECYRNYFLAMFTDERGRAKGYEIFGDDDSDYDREAISALVTHPEVELITFNGNSYDLPMLMLSLVGVGTSELKEASDGIIMDNLRPWQFYRKHGLREPALNHIDLIEVAPGMASLKIYGGRLHVPKMQDLPIEPSAILSRDEAAAIRRYCKNDNALTWSLRNALLGQIQLRETMSEQYGVDLRSKSDAQIAEAVLKVEFERLTGNEPMKTKVNYRRFRYEPPEYIRFITHDLKDALKTICEADMFIKDTGHVEMPATITKMAVTIGNTTYKIGVGGLHSQESEVSYYADEGHTLQDRDVVSYYPNLMMNMGMSPGSFGSHFPTVYGAILERRLAAKRSGDKVTADSLKITLNGTFGKTSSKYSMLYSPDMMIRTTITGQLSLLMLIEILERCAIPVVSANTDGIVILCPVEREPLLDALVVKWEERTQLETEKTLYRSLHSRDVNNYIAISPDGKVKTKGVYGKAGLMKNPQNEICSEAVVAYLKDGTPLDVTVCYTDDIRKFLTVRTVNGGAVKEGYALGKAIRWYYATGVSGEITYKTNGNTVPRSDGAKPLMDLPDEMPDDVDYQWYLNECNEMLMSLGVIPRPFVEKLPRKNSNAWKALRDAGKIKEGKKGKWEWV